ncbi:MAG: hypothetical protein DMG97_08980 [Acidobacteria bacterium]|nr:MAG: hypothetical protein DMG96_27125 [Acidobacteriota bacterium]PYV74340.1 MAG: hypothetical protein DMG97_08980 [Acidobacteriota bacterium]
MLGSSFDTASLVLIWFASSRMNTVSGLSNDPVEFVHFRCAADDAAESLPGPDLLAQHAVFCFELEMGRDAR